METNPDFLNPCGDKPDRDNPHTLSTSLRVFFTLEYLCADSSLSSGDRLKSAIESASDIQSKMYTKIMPMNGPFSTDGALIENNQSENVNERFADAMGYKVFSRYLKRQSNTEERRNLFLANGSWLCNPPGLNEMYPEEAQTIKEYSLEEHSEGKMRRLETLTPEIREALGCTKDFEKKDCPI